MQLPRLLASAALVVLATALATGSSTNGQDDAIAAPQHQQPLVGSKCISTQGDQNPVVGSPCSDNTECAVNTELYCSVKHGNTCQVRSGPGEACEVTDACYQGECRGGICGGKKKGELCNRDVDCADSLICRPESDGLVRYKFACNPPAQRGNLGYVCRTDQDCGFPFFCVLENGGMNKYCGVYQKCVHYGESCSKDKDCCRARCQKLGEGDHPASLCRGS